MAASQTWNISGDFGNNFCGGKATISWEYVDITSEQTFVFHIRGKNPSEQTVETYIGATPWYARPIAKHEGKSGGRNYAQFNPYNASHHGPDWDDWSMCPNRESRQPPYTSTNTGWGIFQLTNPTPSRQELWNWKANIDQGKAQLANPCHTSAAAWIASQEAQQQAEEPTKPLQNFIFTFNGVDFQKGTARTPTHACTIQRFNGAPYWVIYWKNKTPTQPGSWEINNSYRAYVDAVCGELP